VINETTLTEQCCYGREDLERYTSSRHIDPREDHSAGNRLLLLVIGLRLAGKRELAQLNPFDLIVLLTLSNTVQNAIIGNDNS